MTAYHLAQPHAVRHQHVGYARVDGEQQHHVARLRVLDTILCAHARTIERHEWARVGTSGVECEETEN